MKQLLHLTERPFKMADDEVYSLITVRRGNNGVVSRGRYQGRKVLVKAQFKVEADDFVISKRQIVHQACGIVPAELDGAIVSNEYNVFKPSSECCIRYFDYFCYRPEMRHAFFLSCVGVHLEKMLFKTSDWLKRRFYFPSSDEQRKIAEFLTAVDGRIGQLSQKKALLEDYKKGVMQQLFTQTLRFKDADGHEFPDWEEKTLGAVASFSKGCGISKAEVHEDGVLPCIRYGELYTHYAELISDVKSRTNVPEKDLVLSQRNDVIIPASGETHIDIATASCVTVDGVALGGDLNIIRTKQNGVFLAYYLNNACKHAIAGMAQGSSVIHLYPDQLKRLRLHLPSVNEQTKIANFLTALDRKIESVAQQITHTQVFKQGLLQQMFV